MYRTCRGIKKLGQKLLPEILKMSQNFSLSDSSRQTPWPATVMTLSFLTDMPGQTVQTQIRLLLEEQSDQGLQFCHSVSIIWTHYSMVEPHSLNFRMITTIFLGVRKFWKFTVLHFLILLLHFYALSQYYHHSWMFNSYMYYHQLVTAMLKHTQTVAFSANYNCFANIFYLVLLLHV